MRTKKFNIYRKRKIVIDNIEEVLILLMILGVIDMEKKKSKGLEVRCCYCHKVLATMEQSVCGQVELVCPSCRTVTYRCRTDVPWSEVWNRPLRR